MKTKNEPDGMLADRPPAQSARNYLDNIQSVFKLKVWDFARAMKMSPREAYQWLKGHTSAGASRSMFLGSLSAAADAFQEAGVVKRAPVMVKLRVFDGKSLLDLAAEDQLSRDHVENLISEARAMEAAYERSGLRQVRGKPTDDWKSEISIPGGFE